MPLGEMGAFLLFLAVIFVFGKQFVKGVFSTGVSLC